MGEWVVGRGGMGGGSRRVYETTNLCFLFRKIGQAGIMTLFLSQKIGQAGILTLFLSQKIGQAGTLTMFPVS